MIDGRHSSAPATTCTGRRRARRLRHRRRRRPRRQAVARGHPEDRPGPEERRAPRRRLRRRRRRGRADLPDPAGVLPGGGEETPARPGPLPQARRPPRRRRRSSSPTPTTPAAIRPRRSIRDVLAGGPGPLARLPAGADQRRRPARPGPPHAGRSIEQLLLRVEGDPDAAELWLYRAPARTAAPLPAGRARRLHPDALGPAGQLQGAAHQPAVRRLLPGPRRPGVRDRASPSSTAATRPTPTRTGRSPSRSGCSCHNGEINTIRTNRNAVHAYARGLEPPLPGGDLLTPEDERLGQPRRVGRAPGRSSRTGACCGRCG